MESNGAENFFVGSEAEGSETFIEIKIKTLDSQTYTLRVDKQVPVPALKEQIASVTGVLSEQQRLICRGKVLKDDQLLSAYHVEDGHTLHLVVRQPVPPSSDGTLNNPGTSRNHGNQVPSNVVIETFNVPDRGDGVPPEINQIVSAVLGSFGFSNIGIGGNVIDLREHVSQRHEGTSVDSGVPDLTQQPPEQGGVRVQSNQPQSAFGIPTAISLGTLPPPVIPDSLTTLTVYLSQMRHDVDAYGRGVGSNAQASAMDSTEERDSNLASHSGTVREPLQQEGVLREGFVRDGLPTPAALAEVMMSTRQFLIEQTAECLQLLVGLLDNQANVNESSVRNSSQASTWRTGLLLHNLGAYLLELGRTTMTMRFGQTPSEAVINAGPAVFISPSGPNPLMVQPLSSFGAIPVGPVQPPGSGLANGRGVGFHPRRIDIQIRRGSNVNQDERGNNQQTQGQVNSTTASGTGNLGSQTTSRNPEGPSVAGESGVRVLPIRTMVAAMPAPFSHLPSDSSGNPVGLYYPVLGRFQHVATGLVSGEQGHQASSEQGHQASSEHRPLPVQTEQPSVPGSVWQQNVENPPRNGSSPNPSSRQRDPSRPRSVNVSILSARGTLNSQEPERQIHSGVFQLLRNLFPAGEVHLDDASLEGTAPGSVPDRTALPVADRAALPVADQAGTPVADHAGTPVEDCVAAPVADRTATSVADGADCTGTSNGPSAEANVTDEGIFLSNLLNQIMPVISQHTGAEPIAASMVEANTSEYRVAQESSTHAGSSNVGTARRQSDSEPSLPNTKRQKIE